MKFEYAKWSDGLKERKGQKWAGDESGCISVKPAYGTYVGNLFNSIVMSTITATINHSTMN